jgi:hypothetical protein
MFWSIYFLFFVPENENLQQEYLKRNYEIFKYIIFVGCIMVSTILANIYNDG